MVLYADTSALAKLVLAEPESPALRIYLAAHSAPVSSALALTELVRAARRLRPGLEAPAQRLTEHIILVEVDRDVLTRAAAVGPPEIRTLDAIHLATALLLGAELEALVTYDVRMVEAARASGMRVESPA